jgi:hypothetical protein
MKVTAGARSTDRRTARSFRRYDHEARDGERRRQSDRDDSSDPHAPSRRHELTVVRSSRRVKRHVVHGSDELGPRAGGLAIALAVLASATASVVFAAADATAQVPKPAAKITLAWVGDIALSRDYGLPPRPHSIFAHVRDALRSADLTMGNLEGTLGDGGTAKCAKGVPNCFSFQAPPNYADVFASAGFDLMNVANNHAYDYGAAGQASTLAALRRAHLRFTGRPGQITLLRRHGTRLALLGFAPYPWASNLLDLATARRLIRRAKRHADVVVVLMHAGAEGADEIHTPFGSEFAFGEDRGKTRRFAHTAVDAGAGLVLGSGPHVVRGLERYHGGLIAYSLGNFAASHTLGISGVLGESAILRVTVDKSGRLQGGRWTSIRLEPPGIPLPDRSRASLHLVRAGSAQDFGRRAERITPHGQLLLRRG